jgi:hypothetical protein
MSLMRYQWPCCQRAGNEDIVSKRMLIQGRSSLLGQDGVLYPAEGDEHRLVRAPSCFSYNDSPSHYWNSVREIIFETTSSENQNATWHIYGE